MKIQRHDVLGPARYGPMRDEFRRRAIEKNKLRRVFVGDRIYLVFENRDTLLFQIEEMLRAEGITADDKIREEIDVYNTLMPTPDSLSATLFVPVLEGEEPRAALGRFVGIDEHVTLEIGEHRVRAAFEPGRQEEDRISAVQYTRFPLTPEAKAALATPGTRLTLVIDHPNYRHRTELSEESRASLARDVA